MPRMLLRTIIGSSEWKGMNLNMWRARQRVNQKVSHTALNYSTTKRNRTRANHDAAIYLEWALACCQSISYFWRECKGLHKHNQSYEEIHVLNLHGQVADRRSFIGNASEGGNPLLQTIKWRELLEIGYDDKAGNAPTKSYKVMLKRLEEEMEVSVKGESDATAVPLMNNFRVARLM